MAPQARCRALRENVEKGDCLGDGAASIGTARRAASPAHIAHFSKREVSILT